jgi:hypothetical protein
MTVQRDPDAILAAWLEEGPNQLPEQTRRAISFTTRTTEQKRRPSWALWRTPLMPTFARLAVATIALIAFVGGAVYFMAPQQGAGGAPPSPSPTVTSAPTPASPSPEAQATVPTEWTHYTSSRFAYSADYPSAWGVTPATHDWPAIGIPDHGGVSVDNFGPRPFGIQLTVSSVLLKADADTAARIAEIDALNQAFCDPASNRHSVTVDGATLRQQDQVCADSANIIEIVGAGGGRFYQINFARDDSTPLTATDRATFDRFLASFRFDG